MINICIYEDDGYGDLLPLTFTRPAYDLLLGTSTLFDKIKSNFKHGNMTLHCRDYLTSTVKNLHPDIAVNKINSGSACLFFNGRVIMTDKLAQHVNEQETENDLLFTHRGQVIALYLHGERISQMRNMLDKIPSNAEIIQFFRPKCVAKELEDMMIVTQLWDLFTFNSPVLKMDFKRINQPGIIKGDVKPLTAIYNEYNVFIEKNSLVEDFVVIDATKGPVFIEENVFVQSHSRLEGPLYVGKNSQILGARIGSSSVGHNCKIGGEVKNSIILSYSNKAHQGFLGHSYIGEWVNLGANTTNSNLKNNYRNVKLEMHNQTVETERLFLGAIIGDHVKTGIGTKLNTGSIIGYGSSLVGTNMHDKNVPPFSWGEANNYTSHKLDKFFLTAEAMMKRRHIDFHTGQRELVELLYERIASPNKTYTHV